jgi:hypothetical protein
MAHIKFNHLNANAFNSFVPEATKVANSELFKKVLLVGGIALVVWGIYKLVAEKTVKEEEREE